MTRKAIYIIGICAAIAILIAAFSRNSLNINVSRGTTVSDTVIVRDTVLIEKPTPVDTILLPSKIVKLPIYHTDTIRLPCEVNRDSIEVVVPIVQKEYKDSLYQAWVSGYEANLDSIRIFQRTMTITNTNYIYKKKRFGVGLQLGIGINHKGNINPYVGVGISYNLINF